MSNLKNSLTDAEQKAKAAIKADEYFMKDSDGNFREATLLATTAWGENDWKAWLTEKGTDPEEVTFTFGVTSNPSGGYWNKLLNVRYRNKNLDDNGDPLWPVVQPAALVKVSVGKIPSKPARRGLRMSIKGADTQIGYRAVGDAYEAFHDDLAMDIFIQVVRDEQPEEVIILGDFLDLASQGRFAQEAGFSRTTQMSIDKGHEFLAKLRAVAPKARIVVVEGNHDKRMQRFIEQNALAAFGIRRANLPEEWPTMSLPFLLRLEELNIEYQDAYPAAVYWDDDRTRNIHGTRANSKGSTMAQYANDLPHINTWAGHTHRTEIIYKTVLGPRGEAIESYSANPGCLCRTDGTVPSVHGAIHSDGSSARVVEDWQAGFGVNLYDTRGQSWPQVYRIKDGQALYNGKMYVGKK